MARSDDLIKGIALGVPVAMLVPVVIATLAPVVRPMARQALKAGIRVYEKGRETVEEFNETVDDIVAEVEEELIDAREAVDVTDSVDEDLYDEGMEGSIRH